MLSFATEFPVCETSSERFVEAVRAWISGSPHAKLTAEHLSSIPTSGRWKVDSGSVSLEAILTKEDQHEIAAFRYSALDRDIQWVTEVTYSKTPEDDWIGIRTDREATRPLVSLPPAKKPYIVRTLIEKLGGGLDDELHVSDSAHHFSELDTRMAIRLLNADAENYLPLAYVSCPFTEQSIINAELLAKSLGGMAHVIVEPSRSFSKSIQRDVGSRNVYGGSIGVYWPNGEKYRYYINDITPTEAAVRQAIVSDIRSALINRRPLARCTWARAEADLARSVFETLKNSGSEDVSEYVSAFDSEIRAKDEQLSEAEKEIKHLKSRIRSLEFKNSTHHATSWEICSEQQLRKGEFDEVIRDALIFAAANVQAGSRRQDIITAAAYEIQESSYLKDSREILKQILRNYTSMSGDISRNLKELGFDISDDGKHYKLIYMQDDRYVFSLPKSGSDWRGGMNSVSDIAKRVF